MIKNTKFKNLDLPSEKMAMMQREKHRQARLQGLLPRSVHTSRKWALTWKPLDTWEMEGQQPPSPKTKCMAFLRRVFKNVKMQLSIKEQTAYLHSARSCSIFLATQVFLRAIEADTLILEWATTTTWSRVALPRNVQDQLKVSLRMVNQNSTTNMPTSPVLGESTLLVLNTWDLIKVPNRLLGTTASLEALPLVSLAQLAKRRRTSRLSPTTSTVEGSRPRAQVHLPRSRVPLRSTQQT